MRTLSISYKDLQIFVRDRGALLWTFVLPMLFITLFTGISSTIQGGQKEKAITLAVVNLDGAGKETQELIQGLQNTGKLELELLDQAQADAMRAGKNLLYLLTIPQGFSQAVANGQPSVLNLERFRGDVSEFDSLRLIVDGVARGMALRMDILGSLRQLSQMLKSDPQAVNLISEDQMIQQAQSQFEHTRQAPLVYVEQSVPTLIQAKQEARGAASALWVQAVVPGFTVLFVFLTAQITARSIYDEKQVGSFRRLVAAPLSRVNILIGKLVPNFLIVLAQIVLLFAAGFFLLPLIGVEPLSLGDAPLALTLVALATALCSTSLGILIAAVARTEAQISGMGQLVLWLAGLIGGCIVPLTIFNNTVLETVSKFVPQSWALTGFQDVMVRGYGIQGILPEVAVLLGFSLVFFAVGLWRFDFD